MSLHSDLLGRLQAVASVQLVARLQDDRLNFPQAGELHVFLPASARRAPAIRWMSGRKTCSSLACGKIRRSAPRRATNCTLAMACKAPSRSACRLTAAASARCAPLRGA